MLNVSKNVLTLSTLAPDMCFHTFVCKSSFFREFVYGSVGVWVGVCAYWCVGVGMGVQVCGYAGVSAHFVCIKTILQLSKQFGLRPLQYYILRKTKVETH